jgi:hypothetical protein
MIFMMQEQLIGVTTNKQNLLKSRTVTITHGLKLVQKQYHHAALVGNNQEEYVLVSKRLIGDKLTRYFTETSAAVIAMSCCPEIQVHRRCLRDMFHAAEHRCCDQCPGCSQKVDQHIFAQSRPNYISTQHRKKSCDFCNESLITNKNK